MAVDRQLRNDIRDLEKIVAVVEDDDVEDLLLLKYLEREQDLVEATIDRRERWFDLDKTSSAA